MKDQNFQDLIGNWASTTAQFDHGFFIVVTWLMTLVDYGKRKYIKVV